MVILGGFAPTFEFLRFIYHFLADTVTCCCCCCSCFFFQPLDSVAWLVVSWQVLVICTSRDRLQEGAYPVFIFFLLCIFFQTER